MVWGLFLMIYGEQIREGFNSHMIATYETAEECIQTAKELRDEHADTNVNPRTWGWMPKNVKYQCAPIPKQ